MCMFFIAFVPSSCNRLATDCAALLVEGAMAYCHLGRMPFGHFSVGSSGQGFREQRGLRCFRGLAVVVFKAWRSLD